MFFDWVLGQYESATSRAPIDRENAPFVTALAFKVAHGAGCAIRPDKGLCGYVFARACALENTILLAPSQNPPPTHVTPKSRSEWKQPNWLKNGSWDVQDHCPRPRGGRSWY